MEKPSFNDYIQDRKYTRNVSTKTLAWYTDVWRAFGPHLNTDSAQSIRESVRRAVADLLAKGIRPVSVNSWLTGVRAYCLWLHAEGHLKERPSVKLLKCEQRIIQTLGPEQIKRIVGFKPHKLWERRAHALACTLLDSGLRAAEALGLTKGDVDLDNLVLKVNGKGGKHRLVPFSFELRKLLWRYQVKTAPHAFVFGTQNNTQVSVRNFERDLKKLGKRLGIAGVRFSPHTLRHTFAASYLRRGGNLFYLSKILGHSSIKTTERYLQSLGIEDLKAVHNELSLLGR
jgi:integrase/recombinase XerD